MIILSLVLILGGNGARVDEAYLFGVAAFVIVSMSGTLIHFNQGLGWKKKCFFFKFPPTC